MQASKGGQASEALVVVIWMVVLGGTILGAGYVAWIFPSTWNFFLRVLARGALLTLGLPLVGMLFAGARALHRDTWESDRAPIGSGWLAKSVAGVCVLLAVLSTFAIGFTVESIVAEMLRLLAFGSVALLASPAIEGAWRRRVTTAFTILVAAGIGMHTAQLLADDAPNFWLALLAAFAGATLGYGLQLAVALWLRNWTRRRLEARAEPQTHPVS